MFSGVKSFPLSWESHAVFVLLGLLASGQWE